VLVANIRAENGDVDSVSVVFIFGSTKRNQSIEVTERERRRE